MSDTIGRVTVPAPPDSGAIFPLAPDFGYGMMRSWPVITHRFGDLATKATQRFQVGIGPRKFSFRKQSLSIRDRETLTDFFETVQGSYQSFTYKAPNLDRGATSTPYKVVFETQPLSIDDLANRCQVGTSFIEIPDPSSAPVYTVNSTCTRFPSDTLKTALLSQVQQIIPLVHIKVVDSGVPDIHLSDRRCTVGGQLYQARLLDLGEPGSDVIITQDIKGSADDVHFSFGNADRVMTALSNDCDLKYATIDLSLYHVNSGILLQLWKGFIQSYQTDGTPVFQVRASDGLYQVNLQYPTRVVSRSCWKTFNDGFNCPYATKGSGGDPTSCDYFFDSANGCQAHGMADYFGGHPVQPEVVRVKDNSTGVWGFGRNVVSATSIVSDSVWGQALPEIWCNDGGDPRRALKLKGLMVAGRDEGDFFDGLAIVGAGPIGAYTKGYLVSNADGYRYFVMATLDGQPGFGFNLAQFLNQPPTLVFTNSGVYLEIKDLKGSLRAEIGNDPGGLGGWDETAQQFIPGGGFSTLDEAFGLGSGNAQFGPSRAAGTAFVELRRTDPSGIQPSLTDEHDMEVFVSKGLVGWVWDAAGNRTAKSGITNPFWIAVNSYLRAIGLFTADSATQLAAFVLPAVIDGAGNGCAEIADLQVTPLFGTGTETQFQFQGVLAQQKPFRDWLTEILNCGLGYYTWEFGKLRLGIRENASAVEAFTFANMLFQSLVLSGIEAGFEKLVMDFADQNYQFQANTSEYVDKAHARLYGRADSPLTTRIHSVGVPSTSQAGRIIATRVREEIGGIDQNEWKAARNATWLSTLLAVNCAVGNVVEIEHPDVPGGLAKFRIQTMRFRKDWSIEFEAKTVTDSMYALDIGPKPADVVPLPLPAVFFPIPQGEWAPYQLQAPATDALFPGEWTFDIGVNYEILADTTTRATAPVKGLLPVNQFVPNCGAPVIHRGAITQSTTGGLIKGGRIYRVSICALTADGRSSPAAEPLYVATTPDTDTHQFTISGILWPPVTGLTKWVIFVSDVDDLICMQATGDLTDTGGGVYNPTVITIGSGPSGGPLERSTWAVPNQNLKLVRLKQKRLNHGGVLGAPVTSVGGSQFVAPQCIDAAGIDNWAGRFAIVIGRPTGSVPFLSFKINTFDPGTGTFTCDQNVEAAGLLPGDVIVVTFAGYDNSATPMQFTDLGISNALNYDIVTGASTPHSGLATDQDKGAIVRVICGTNRGAYAKIVSNTTLTYNFDRELVIGPDSIIIVEAGAWEVATDSTPVNNGSTTAGTTITVPVDNYLKQSILVAGFTVDLLGNESGEFDAPVRMLYVYGNPGFGVYDKATFNIKVASDLTVGTDVAPHYIIRNAGSPSADFPCEFRIKVPSAGADAILDIKYTPPGATVGGGSTVSVFNAGGSKLTFPAGSTATLNTTDFDPSVSFEELGVLTCDILQVGSTTAGQCATVVFKWRIKGT